MALRCLVFSICAVFTREFLFGIMISDGRVGMTRHGHILGLLGLRLSMYGWTF